MIPLSDIESVYSKLLWMFRRAAVDGDDARRDRIFAATNLFQDLWPEDVGRYEARFSSAAPSRKGPQEAPAPEADQ